jgi:type IV pilus assembly protein PilW
MEVLSHAYYVDTATNNIPSIYRQEITGGVSSATEELSQGIENIQAFFGIDTDADKIANQYLIASSVTDWTQVVSVRIHVLARSISQTATQATPFRYLGNTWTPTDRYLRKEFISTVKIRNRGI